MATPTGVIYYTLDGEDPREIGGAIGAKAREWLPNQRLDFQVDTRVMARVWTGAEWSALSDAHFQVGEAVSPIALRISEVHYHPLPASDVEVAAGLKTPMTLSLSSWLTRQSKRLILAVPNWCEPTLKAGR